jgi:phage shock protein PspC (stress-responsive transcriptional regulator)
MRLVSHHVILVVSGIPTAIRERGHHEFHSRPVSRAGAGPRPGRRVLGGVIAGLGRRIGLDPWPARLLFILALLVIPGSQILLYPILWILMPLERPDESPVAANGPTGGPQLA